MLKVPITTVAMMTIECIFRAFPLRAKHCASCGFKHFRCGRVALPQVVNSVYQSSIGPIDALHGSPSFACAASAASISDGRPEQHRRRPSVHKLGHPLPCERTRPYIAKFFAHGRSSWIRQSRLGFHSHGTSLLISCGQPRVGQPLAAFLRCVEQVENDR